MLIDQASVQRVVSKSVPRLFRLYGRVLRAFGGAAVRCIGMVTLSALLEASALLFLAPILNRKIADSAAGTGSGVTHAVMAMFGGHRIRYAFAAFVVVGLLSTAARMISEKMMVHLRVSIEHGLRRRMTDALLHMDWVYFTQLRQGDIGKSIYVEGFYTAFGCYSILNVLSALMTVAVFITASSFISLSLTGMALAFAAVSSIGYIRTARLVSRYSKDFSTSAQTLGEQTVESFQNLKAIRASGKTAVVREEMDRTFQEYAAVAFGSEGFRALVKFTYDSCGVVLLAGFLGYGLFLSGRPVEWVMVFMAVFYRLMPRIQSIQNDLYTARLYASFLVDWNDRYAYAIAHAEPLRSGGVPPVLADIRFENVSCRYPDRQVDAVHDLSFHLPQGQCIVLMGGSGAGKSTILDLMTGLIRPTQGRILIGGQNLDEADHERWRAQIGIVQQGAPLFFGTLLQNIAWGEKSPDPARAERCARLAHAWEFIAELPAGLDSLVQEKAASLSGGQRQRLTLARALYREPSLLILDEPTSEVDNDSEAKIFQTLEALKGRVSMVIVSHRPLLFRLADEVLAIENGTLADRRPWHPERRQELGS